MNRYKSEPTEYVDIDRWRKAIRDSRLHDEAEVQKLKGRIESMAVELELLERKLEHYRVEEELMSQTICAYEERMRQPSKRSPLQGDNLREILIIHFADPGGIIIGKEVSRTLVDIGYFSNRNSADGAIYTALGKSPFQKLDKGIYVIPTDSPEWNRLKGTNGKGLHISRLVRLAPQKPTQTGLKDKVNSILVEQPSWSREQVSKELQRQGWDFGGKYPKRVVAGAFANIAKDKRRVSNQTLPLRLHSTS